MSALRRIVFLAALCASLLSGAARAGDTGAFTAATVDAFERLPVQEGGRVKPMASFARFTLLRTAGTTSPREAGGERCSASAWLLRLMLYPELAKDDPVLLVEDAQALVAVGLADASMKKRDRWPHARIATVLPALLERAHAAESVAAGARSSVQSVTLRTAEVALNVLRVGRSLDFARHRIPLQEGTRVARLFTGRDDASVADVIEHAPEIAALERELAPTDDGREKGAIAALWRVATDLCADGQSLAWIPPVAGAADAAAWRTPADLLVDARRGSRAAPEHMELLRAAEEVVARRTDPARLEAAMTALVARVESLAAARGDAGTVRLEARYHALGLLGWSTALFVVGFALCAIGWLRPRTVWLQRAATAVATVAIALLVAAIAMRCVIRGRPPVSTLYETVLFVTAATALTAIVVGRIQRERVHLAVACLAGCGGLMLAGGYEALDGQDTMPNLVAVLDTNFWLATHVTAITLGYSAGLLAALLGSVHVIVALVRGARADAARQRSLARATYGVTCFALCFSVVGTILGGIWANESWGRFWGWDPKENGALLICIAQIALVHARRAGLVRDHGTCVAAAFGGTVVAFSWWGVNLLGVGLHSYGFTSGIQTALWTYYGLQWSVVAAGLIRARTANPTRTVPGTTSTDSTADVAAGPAAARM